MLNQQAELKAKLFDLIEENEKLKKEVASEKERVSELEAEVHYLSNVNRNRSEKIREMVIQNRSLQDELINKTREIQKYERRYDTSRLKNRVENEIATAIEQAFAKHDVALF